MDAWNKWDKFRQLAFLLTNKDVSFYERELILRLIQDCMLRGKETWPVKENDMAL